MVIENGSSVCTAMVVFYSNFFSQDFEDPCLRMNYRQQSVSRVVHDPLKIFPSEGNAMARTISAAYQFWEDSVHMAAVYDE